MSGKQLAKHLKVPHDASDGELQSIILSWDNRKNELINDLKKIIRITNFNRAQIAIEDANNHFLFSRLYLSDELAEVLENLTRIISSYMVDVEYTVYGDDPETDKLTAKSLMLMQDRISQLLNSAKKTMQVELKIGYYEND